MDSLRTPAAPHSSASSVFDLPITLDAANSRQLTPAPLPATHSGPADHTSHSFLVISGGTGCNSICSAFGRDVCYVLPVSDNGGSSSEVGSSPTYL